MQKETINNIKEAKNLTLSDITHKNMTIKPIKSRNKYKITNIMRQGSHRDSALCTARDTEKCRKNN